MHSLTSATFTILALAALMIGVSLAQEKQQPLPISERVLSVIGDKTSTEITKLEEAAIIAKIRESNVDELPSLFDYLKSANLPEPLKVRLQVIALTQFGQINTLQTLDMSIPSVYDFPLETRKAFYRIFRAWAWKQPQQTEKWLNKAIAAGQLHATSADGMNRPLNGLEAHQCSAWAGWGKLIPFENRIINLSDQVRSDVFDLLDNQILMGKEAEYFKILRKYYREDIVADGFRKAVNIRLRYGNRDKATALIENTDFSDEHIAEATRSASCSVIADACHLGKLNSEEILKTCEWVKKHSPLAYPKNVGWMAYTASTRQNPNSFEEALAVLKTQEKEPTYSEIVIKFYKLLTSDYMKLKCRPLLKTISDPTIQSEIERDLKRASYSNANSHPKATLK